MPMAFQLLLVISGVESPTQATEDSKKLENHPEYRGGLNCNEKSVLQLPLEILGALNL